MSNTYTFKKLTTAVILCFTLANWSYSQSLQWSQYTSPNASTDAVHSTVSLEKEMGGAIYTLSQGHTGSATPPVFPTDDVVYYGNFANANNDNNAFAYLSKYSADGSTLEWVRFYHPIRHLGRIPELIP